MKDSFIFEGKKYISAKRASEISDYSSDYIGQLCRAEKLDCRMIGRSWFVTLESIHLHQANVLHDEIYRNRIQNLKGGKRAQPEITQVAASEPVARVPVSEAISETVSEEKLVYETDNRPLMPVLVKGDEAEFVSHHLELRTEVPVAEEFIAKETYPEIARGLILRRALQATIVLVVAFGLITGGITILSSQSNSMNGQVASASIHDALDSVSNFISGGFNSILALFGHGRDVAVNQTPAATASSAPVSDNTEPTTAGIAVAPSSGSDTTDAAMKQKIQASFSDQVEVHPDQSGTTGVITPVFREAKGKDFIYVMVPVTSNHSP